MIDTPVLSVLILSWNTRGLLRELLTSWRQHAPAESHEVIVVDNGSSDESAGMVRREFPWVRLIENSSNDGYARGNNQAYAASSGEFLLLLGSDTVIIDDSVQRMTSYLRSHTDIAGVACRLLNPDRTPQRSCRRFPTLWDGVLTYMSLHALAGRYNMRDFDFAATQQVDQPAATCLMLRRTVIGRSGLFDENYSILYNDVDLCERIASCGGRLMYLGDAEIVHYGSQSTKQATPHVRLEMYRNILRYYRARSGIAADLFLRPILFVRLLSLTRHPIAFRILFGGEGRT